MIFNPEFILFFFYVLFVENNRRLTSHMILMEKNLKQLDMDPGQLVRLVTNWLGCCVV